MAFKNEKNPEYFFTLGAANNTTPSHLYTGGAYTLTAGTTTVPGMTGVIQTPSPLPPIITRCASDGHQMFTECELADGTITGMCEQCGEIIKGRRVAGGLATLQLRQALEDVLAGDKDMLTEEFLVLANQVEAEEAALQEARSLLRLAERVLLRNRVPA